LQWVNVSWIETPVQSLLPVLTQQLRAAAVSSRASWRVRFPIGLTQIASRADWLSPQLVLVIGSPQMVSVPPQALMAAWVMFWLLSFSVPP
jgi:hypothetical protein